MRHPLFTLTMTAALAGAMALPVFAQQDPNTDIAIPSSNAGTPQRARIHGTITFVRGHLVTLQLADRTIVINDQPALDRRTSGRVAVGRQIIAYGFWRDGNFYATQIV
ncbi:MAG TPA: hypothetical protein VMA98_09165 [Candidatus Acidoferrales bacterium]|nr:hypothetical protein [Candidatus Acidoferrales bacterium]